MMLPYVVPMVLLFATGPVTAAHAAP